MNSTGGTGLRLVGKVKITPAADSREVVREQLEYLIEHIGDGAFHVDGCSLCKRYLAAREILLEAFRDS